MQEMRVSIIYRGAARERERESCNLFINFYLALEISISLAFVVRLQLWLTDLPHIVDNRSQTIRKVTKAYTWLV